MRNESKIFIILTVTILICLPSIVSSIALDDLDDVIILNPLNTQHLVYNSATSNWTNQNFVGDGYAPNTYEHDQQLNTTSGPTFATINTGNGAVECFAQNQDLETTDTVQFGSIGILGSPNYELTVLGTSSDANIEAKSSSYNANFRVDSKSGGTCAYYMLEGGTMKAGFFYAGPSSNFRIGCYTGSWGYPVTITNNAMTNGLFITSTQVFINSDAGTAGKECDVEGDLEADTYANECDKRLKTTIFNTKDLPDNKILELCSMINIYVFEWTDPNWIYENGSKIPFYTEGYGISAYAQDLYWQLKNFTNNQNLNNKLADGIVNVGGYNREWSVNTDAILWIYARAVQILIEEVFKDSA